MRKIEQLESQIKESSAAPDRIARAVQELKDGSMRLLLTVLLSIPAVISLLLTGCATYTPTLVPEYTQPIKVENSSPIAFKKALLRIPAGTQIGYHHDGLLKIRQFAYSSQSTISAGSAEFNIVANEELKSAGYKVVGDAKVLFEESAEWKARFLLGASILQIAYNTYAPLAGNCSECSVLVKWELMDKMQRRVIYESNTQGYFKLNAQGTGAIYLAFRLALRELLADNKFADLVVGSAITSTESINPATVHTVLLPRVSILQGIQPDIIDYAKLATVTVLTESGHASGFFISTEGHIITNAHAVADMNFVDVRLANGIRLQANVLHSNTEYDVAIIEVNGSGFRALPLFDQGTVRTGQEVYAIGTPAFESLAQSVTKGIISGTRVVATKEYIQTDVKVNPGNSGGPLVDSSGRVLGIITWKVVAIGYEGLAFCVPIQTALEHLGIKVE